MLHGRPEKDWAQSAVFYQIYPMGFCGAPFENDGVAVNRIQKVKEWIPHLEKLGIGAIYFSPVFESDTHGYDTRDYTKIDCRLGTNQEFKEVCEALHRAGIPCEAHFFPSGIHGLSVCTQEIGMPHPHNAQWMDLCLRWLEATFGYTL